MNPKNNNTSGCMSYIVTFIILIIIFVLFLKSCSCSPSEVDENNSDYDSSLDTSGYNSDYDSSFDFDSSSDIDEDDEDDSDFDSSAETENQYTDGSDSIQVSDYLKRPKFSAKPNTDNMVLQISHVAKLNIDYFTSSDAKKIISKKKKAKHDFYGSAKEMEKYMWYGFLLDYKYDDSDPRSELGTDLTQAIKYVYRGHEKETDAGTKENLRQIDKDLSRIYK